MGEYGRLLRHNKNYRILWLALLTSLLGDWFNLIASAELTTTLTSSGFALSLLFLSRFVPSFIISPFAGLLADRMDRRLLMVVSDWARAGIVLCFLFIRNENQIWLLYVLTALQFALSALFVPAKQAIIVQIVEKDDLVTANALNATTWSVMLAVGSLLGGVVAGVFGRETAFIMDALTFLLSGFFVLQLPKGEKKDVKSTNRDGFFTDIVGGVQYLWQYPLLLAVSVAKAAGSLVWGAINVLDISFAEDVFADQFSNSSIILGAIYAAAGLGTGVGPLVLRRLLGDKVRSLTLGIWISFVMLMLGLLAIGFEVPFWLFLFLSAVRTFGSGGLWVFSTVLLQLKVEDEVRGRVFAFEFAMLTLTQSISILWAGYALDRLGWSAWSVTWAQAAVAAIMLGWWSFVLLRQRFNIEQ